MHADSHVSVHRHVPAAQRTVLASPIGVATPHPSLPRPHVSTMQARNRNLHAPRNARRAHPDQPCLAVTVAGPCVAHRDLTK